MRRFVVCLALLLSALPGWCARKITVAQLIELLHSLAQEKKSDLATATALKQVELTEQITRAVMNNLATSAPGPQTTEQIYVLEARSAILAPPPADIPATPAPDAATQKAILDKAADYIAKTYAQLPELTATKTTVRFQDNVEAPISSSGMVGSSKDNTMGSSLAGAGPISPAQYIHYIGSTESRVESKNGVENPPSKDKTRWGANGQIALFGPEPNLSIVLREAWDSGGFTWLRWETINGKPAAVFSFSVQKKKSHYAVDYCCFPDVSQAGIAGFHSASTAGFGGSGPGGAVGNFQTATYWHDFKASDLPYRGELFLDPLTGVIVRLNTMAEFKNTDVVHQEDRRIDYVPTIVGGKTFILPLREMINTEVVPTGDSNSAGKYATRRTLLTAEYKDFQLIK